MNKIRIIYIAPKLNRAGLQIHLLELCKLINRNKYEIWICELSKEKGILRQEFEKIGVNLVNVSYNSMFPIFFAFKIFNFFKKTKPDVLHIQDISIPGCIIALAGKLASVNCVIFTIHGIWRFEKVRRIYFKILFKHTQKITDKFISVSESCRKYYIQNFNLDMDKTMVIYNGIDIKKFHFSSEVKLRKRLNFENTDKLIGSVGRLTRYKNHILIIKALPLILNKFSNVKFILIGNGELRDELEKNVDKMGLRSNVVFLGVRDDIPELLREIDIFIFPSIFVKDVNERRISEAFGIALLEAMASGKPVIAINTGGISEIIENGKNGVLLSYSDPKLLANAIIELIKNREKRIRLGIEARKTVESRFTNISMVEKFEQVYNELLN